MRCNGVEWKPYNIRGSIGLESGLIGERRMTWRTHLLSQPSENRTPQVDIIVSSLVDTRVDWHSVPLAPVAPHLQ